MGEGKKKRTPASLVLRRLQYTKKYNICQVYLILETNCKTLLFCFFPSVGVPVPQFTEYDTTANTINNQCDCPTCRTVRIAVFHQEVGVYPRHECHLGTSVCMCICDTGVQYLCQKC